MQQHRKNLQEGEGGVRMTLETLVRRCGVPHVKEGKMRLLPEHGHGAAEQPGQHACGVLRPGDHSQTAVRTRRLSRPLTQTLRNDHVSHR